MLSKKINTKVIDVELTDERRKKVIKEFLPILRVADGGVGARCDIVVRKIHRMWSGNMYCILVRLITPKQTYYAVANAHHFVQAIMKARDELYKTMNKKYVADIDKIKYVQDEVHKKHFVELFVQ